MLAEVIELDHIVADDLLPHAIRQRAQVGLNVLTRLGPDTVRMRVISSPDNIVLPDQRDIGLEELILAEISSFSLS